MGAIAVVQSLPDTVATVTTETVKVAKDTIIVPKWWEMWWYHIKKTPGIVGRNVGRGAIFLGRTVSVIGIILTTAPSTGCGASPGMMSDGDGGCVRSPDYVGPEIDTSANPNPADNAPNTDVSKSPTLSKTKVERPDTGLKDIPDAEITKRARDRSLPKADRQRYRKEDKIRGNRNKQKRGNK